MKGGADGAARSAVPRSHSISTPFLAPRNHTLTFPSLQVEHVKAERNVLAEVHNPYVVKLYFSFQVRALPSYRYARCRYACQSACLLHTACLSACLS